MSTRLAIVAIGRNEGERLKACLRSLPADARRVYVDSGSTDDSVAFADAMGVEVVTLPPGTRFTAALARNAGLAVVGDPEFVQFLDGDCTLDAGWLDAASAALRSDPGLAVVFGRRRERWPGRSVYNWLCDVEWDVPVGEARACGGDALFRRDAIAAVGGYDPELIAGEEPDLCLRMRARGWRVRRIDAEMTLHDAAMTRIGQWWRRNERAGHAFAEHVRRHGAAADPHWRREVTSNLAWGVALPLLILVAGLAIGGWAAGLLALLYPVQVARLAVRARRSRGWDARHALAYAHFLVLGKFAQAKGVLGYHVKRMAGIRGGLIEYKGPA